MKVVMQGSTTVSGSSTVENIISGQRFERAPWNAIGALYCCGAASNTLTAELNVGGKSITPPTSVNTQARYPVVPDDLLVSEWEVEQGQLIQLRAVNSTATAYALFWRVELEEAVYAA